MNLVGAELALPIQKDNTGLTQRQGRNLGVVHSCGQWPRFIPSPGELTETSLTPAREMGISKA